MDLTRIANVIDVVKILAVCVAIFGAGGSAGLVCNLARCGVRRFKLFDFDRISLTNVARQHHDATDVGRSKVAALADAIRRINPDAIVEVIEDNFLDTDADDLAAHIAECDLLIFATDRFEAQARGNELALQFNVPALWIGLYAGGTAGEAIFWHPDLDACFRCLCAKRYEAQAAASKEQRSLDPASEGCTIFDVAMLDAIVGMLAIGPAHARQRQPLRPADRRVGRPQLYSGATRSVLESGRRQSSPEIPRHSRRLSGVLRLEHDRPRRSGPGQPAVPRLRKVPRAQFHAFARWLGAHSPRPN